MKTPDLTAYFNPACAFSAQSLALTLQSLPVLTASIVITALKEASIRDQGFEQACGFRNAETALSEVIIPSKPKRTGASALRKPTRG
jgi:hypothetical protein